MNYKSFNLGDWIGHISGIIEDETTLDGNEMRDLVEFLTTLRQEPKTGHWIRWYEQKDFGLYIENIPHCKCSECGKEYDSHSSQFIKYCNECGAKLSHKKVRIRNENLNTRRT